MDKVQKILLCIIFVAILVTVGSTIFSPNPTTAVNFWLDTYYSYEKIGNQWLTCNSTDNSTSAGVFIPINCKNNGPTTAEFTILVSLEGASFLTDTPQPYQQINYSTVSFTFKLRIGEQQSALTYFQINNRTDHFTILLFLETNESNINIEPVHDGTDFSGYKELYYIWIPERNVYAPALIN